MVMVHVPCLLYICQVPLFPLPIIRPDQVFTLLSHSLSLLLHAILPPGLWAKPVQDKFHPEEVSKRCQGSFSFFFFFPALHLFFSPSTNPLPCHLPNYHMHPSALPCSSSISFHKPFDQSCPNIHNTSPTTSAISVSVDARNMNLRAFSASLCPLGFTLTMWIMTLLLPQP